MNDKFIYDSHLSLGTEDSKNILIKGDNLKVLPELLPNFSGKVRCIYIDPPYNNGDVYHYYNDNETQDSWLESMRRTLRLLRRFLTEDGSIWISIDDSEMAYLKVESDKILDEKTLSPPSFGSNAKRVKTEPYSLVIMNMSWSMPKSTSPLSRIATFFLWMRLLSKRNIKIHTMTREDLGSRLLPVSRQVMPYLHNSTPSLRLRA